MLSVVVPTYNSLSILKKTLQHNLNYLQMFEIEYVLVDDGSEDETVEYVENHFPTVRVIRLVENLGFSSACNQGVREAKFPFVLLLNNDMLIHRLDIESVIKYLREADVFSVTPKIMRADSNGKFLNESLTVGWFKGGELRTENIGLLDACYQPTEKEAVLWGCGGGMFFTKEKFELLRGFDAKIFSPFYFEDMDLSYRAWLMGWKCYYSECGEFEHFHQGTIGSFFSESYIRRISRRNQYLFFWKNIRDPWMITSHVSSIFLRILTFQLKEWMVIASALFKLPDVLKQSQLSSRKCTDREILSRFIEKF